MWNIGGKTEFSQGKQYEIIDDVNSKLQWMSDHAASAESKIKLEVINRTIGTLTHYVDLMGEQIAHGGTVASNEAVLENIRGVSTVVEAVVQDYVLFRSIRPTSNTAS
jgi:two-component system sensor histidine kinase YesM